MKFAIPVQIPVVCVSLHTNTIGKGTNSSVLTGANAYTSI